MQSFSAEQYRALRERAAIVERSDRGRIAVVGADRLTYLHAMLTNDIASLRPGEGRYSAYLTPQGRMIADMIVLELGDLTLLDVAAAATAVVLEKLEQFVFSEDVRFSDLTPQLGEIRVAGPNAPDVLASVGQGVSLSAGDLAALPEYRALRASFDGGSLVLAADGELGVAAFDIYISRDKLGALTDAVRAAGAAPVTLDAVEVLRIENGRPRFGADMDESTIPLEAGIEERAISFTKGCYPGQEVITRVLHRGHGRIAKKLVGLRCEAGEGRTRVPQPGDAIVAGDKEAGKVTSATLSPALGCAIALGYVQRDFIQPGTSVSIVRGEESLPATVVDVPFVR